MSTEHQTPGHGDSPAAWTTVVIMLIGLSAGAVFFVLNNPVMVWVSVAVVVLGPIIGLIMRAAGYGVNGPKYQPKQNHN